MTAPLSLWATCILPGCTQPVVDALDVCDTCRTIFGDYLRETDRPASYTATDIAERDAGTADAYRRMRELHESFDITAERALLAAKSERAAAQARGEAEKPNQRCWLCEEHRSCIRRPGGWECRRCRDIQ